MTASLLTIILMIWNLTTPICRWSLALRTLPSPLLNFLPVQTCGPSSDTCSSWCAGLLPSCISASVWLRCARRQEGGYNIRDAAIPGDTMTSARMIFVSFQPRAVTDCHNALSTVYRTMFSIAVGTPGTFHGVSIRHPRCHAIKRCCGIVFALFRSPK